MAGRLSLRRWIDLIESSTEEECLYHGTSAAAFEAILRDGVEAPSYWGTREEAEPYADGVLLAVPISRFDLDGLMPNDLLVASMREQGEEVAEPSDWQESLREFGSVRYDYVLHVSEHDLASLAEGKNKKRGPAQPWGVSRSNIFDETLRQGMRTFPDLKEKLGKFVEVKLPNPLAATYGKHDRPCTGPLTGFWHCHLRDDAILIYNLANHCINLVAVVTHADVEGNRLKQTAKRLKSQVLIGKPF